MDKHQIASISVSDISLGRDAEGHYASGLVHVKMSKNMKPAGPEIRVLVAADAEKKTLVEVQESIIANAFELMKQAVAAERPETSVDL